VVDYYDIAKRQYNTSTLSASRISLSAAAAGTYVVFAGGFNDRNGKFFDSASVMQICILFLRLSLRLTPPLQMSTSSTR
jgi:hypothetical protein